MSFIIQLKNLNKILCMFLILCSVGGFVHAAETKFEPIGDVTIKLDGVFYTGILFSEEERLRYIRLDLEYNSITEKLASAELRIKELEQIHNDTVDTTKTQLKIIEEYARNEKETFLDKYGHEIFFISGVVLTILGFGVYEAIR